jgi:hypothetical protein
MPNNRLELLLEEAHTPEVPADARSGAAEH